MKRPSTFVPCRALPGREDARYPAMRMERANVRRGLLVAVLVLITAAATHVGSTDAAHNKAPCSWYVIPAGHGKGRSIRRPSSLSFAAARTVPGDVVCLLPGTYELPAPLFIGRSGSADNWITYRNYGGTALITPGFRGPDQMIQVKPNVGYLAFIGLRFDGKTTAGLEAIHIVDHAHHIRVIDNVITNMSAAGIQANNVDYMTFVGNKIRRFGDGVGWSSGISFNSSKGGWWYDTAPGFHNVFADNMITGGIDNSSHNSDGNGIILDLGGNIAPTLIANNVVYMNGGPGIVSYYVSGQVYVVNNTLYKNALDLRMQNTADMAATRSSNEVWANNVVSAWERRYTYKLRDSDSIVYRTNASFGGIGVSGLPLDMVSDPLQVRMANPLFVTPPTVDPFADQQWRKSPSPNSVGNGLSLQRGSPLVDRGTDPRTLPGLTPALLAGVNRYLMHDIHGTARPAGLGFDLGAYER
jgi:hypothetical protein